MVTVDVSQWIWITSCSTKEEKNGVPLKVDKPEENNIPLFPCPLGLWFFVQSVRTVTKTEKKHIINTCLSGTEQRHNNSA